MELNDNKNPFEEVIRYKSFSGDIIDEMIEEWIKEKDIRVPFARVSN